MKYTNLALTLVASLFITCLSSDQKSPLQGQLAVVPAEKDTYYYNEDFTTKANAREISKAFKHREAVIPITEGEDQSTAFGWTERVEGTLFFLSGAIDEPQVENEVPRLLLMAARPLNPLLTESQRERALVTYNNISGVTRLTFSSFEDGGGFFGVFICRDLNSPMTAADADALIARALSEFSGGFETVAAALRIDNANSLFGGF